MSAAESRTSLSRRVLGSTVGTYHLQPTLLDTESDGGTNSSCSSSTAAAWAFYLPTYLPTYLPSPGTVPSYIVRRYLPFTMVYSVGTYYAVVVHSKWVGHTAVIGTYLYLLLLLPIPCVVVSCRVVM